ncbi:MAG: hypothetical protein ABIL49_03900 [candidate division WOR-3 bacterium]|jgi:hypothetical protein
MRNNSEKFSQLQGFISGSLENITKVVDKMARIEELSRGLERSATF